jgi:hypothetical protein
MSFERLVLNRNIWVSWIEYCKKKKFNPSNKVQELMIKEIKEGIQKDA